MNLIKQALNVLPRVYDVLFFSLICENVPWIIYFFFPQYLEIFINFGVFISHL